MTLRCSKQTLVLALSAVTAFALAGCGQDYVNERLNVPYTRLAIPMNLVDYGALFFAVVGPVLTLVVLYKLFFWRRRFRIAGADSNIELFVSRRKFPVLANALIVPVAPDLKMVFGVAKMARDYGADTAQQEAAKVAPLSPGDAFIGTGARYRFKYTVLAVIFDDQKRTSPELISQGLRRALQLAREQGCQSVIIPDMTENLLAQPSWITPEQRRETAEITARLMLDAILASRGTVKSVRIWVWDPANAEIFQREMERLEAQDGVELAHTCTIRDVMVSLVPSVDLRQLHADAYLNPTTNTLVASATPEPELVGAGVGSLASPSHPMVAALDQRGVGLAHGTRLRGPIPIGDVMLDKGMESPYADHVIHLAVRSDHGPATREAIRQSLLSALALADEKHFRTLILANPGGGPADYPAIATGPVLVDAIREHLYEVNRLSLLERIFLVTTNKDEENSFARAFGRYLPWPVTLPPASEHE